MKRCLTGILLVFTAAGPALALPAEPINEQLEALVRQENQRDPRDGVATYYANRFAGRRTTSGERYDPDGLTAAHATLPLGSVVRVHNDRTNRDVVVRINDRCSIRHAAKNLIDLSRLAAREIGLWGKGMTRVRIVPLSDGDTAMDARLVQELMQ